jgi:hypothetical protein
VPKKPKKNSHLERIAEEIAVGIMRALSKLPEEEQERRIKKRRKRWPMPSCAAARSAVGYAIERPAASVVVAQLAAPVFHRVDFFSASP